MASYESREDLILKVHLLERRVALLEAIQPIHPTKSDPRSRSGSSAINPPASLSTNEKPRRIREKSKRKFEFKHYPTRKIALLVSYQGWDHGGLAWQPEVTPHTTIEGELFKALLTARLVDLADGFSEADREPFLESEKWRATVDLELWDYSRAGRTDAGVSGAGQVVSLWVRSNITDQDARRRMMASGRAPLASFRDPEGSGQSSSQEPTTPQVELCGIPATNTSMPSGREEEELSYATIINSLLPESIRIIAWSPVAPNFDARFSCQGRHYKYFFNRFEASPQRPLDIEAMRDGAKRLVGMHDFRNLCKLDRSKQIENFTREIYSAEISLVDEKSLGPEWFSNSRKASTKDAEKGDGGKNDLYVFDLKGNAFLYNQVRNIMAILFLIGSKLEPPELIDGLLYTDSSALKPEGIGLADGQFVDRKPEMGIASELPLVLWHCSYPTDSFQWQAEALTKPNAVAPSKTLELLRAQAARHRLKSTVALHQIYKLHGLHESPVTEGNPSVPGTANQKNIGGAVCQVFGAGTSQWTKNYRSILNRPRSMSYSESNERWLQGQEARIAEKMDRRHSEVRVRNT